MTFRKAEYIKDFATKVHSGQFDIDGISKLSDDEAIQMLTSLKGVGVWTAEMILLLCLQRANIFSFDDLAIQRGLRMVYHHKKIDRKLFEKYRKRFSPYCSVASLYLWAVAGSAVAQMKDCRKGDPVGEQLILSRDEKIRICKERDAGYAGKFFLAVKSTKIVCRPDCPSKLPLEKNMAFYDTLAETLTNGYRPCKICMRELQEKEYTNAIYE